MSKIFDEDPNSDAEFGTNNEYAKNYNVWRKKEELNRLKTKYGNDNLDELEEESSSSSDDDDDGLELTEQVEKEFYQTLSCLKDKDPRIYDESVQFFTEGGPRPAARRPKERPMFLKDYERQLLLETHGELSEEEPAPGAPSPTYVEEQAALRDGLRRALDAVGEGEADALGGMLRARRRGAEEARREDAAYREWLAGQKDRPDDEQAERDLRPLREYWSDPNLDDGEKFLRDYILKKKFLGSEAQDYIPTYEEVVHDSDGGLSEDEEQIERQEEFEHKYNFRFEEPDQDFIKRYPRIMEQSLRKTDDKRRLKRVETKERKQKEKEQKMQDLKQLQAMKKREIEEKIEKLRAITGNDDLEFQDQDLDGDFDPDAHDKRMQALFNEEFYEGEENDKKPEFPELDKYLELENWDKWQGDDVAGPSTSSHEPHCEDDDFNMDCEYGQTTEQEMIENSKGRKKRKRKSLFSQAVSQPKPVFDPNDKTYEQFLDEYYKFDCEDIIGDIPCKFKYRQVAPNSFGLSVEEILTANDRELNKWCSLKKAIQYRPDQAERYDQIAFAKKADNIDLKRKMLPSLFKKEEDEGIKPATSGQTNGRSTFSAEEESQVEVKPAEIRKGKRNKKGKKAEGVNISHKTEGVEEPCVATEVIKVEEVQSNKTEKPKKKKKKKKTKSVSKQEEKTIEPSNTSKKRKAKRDSNEAPLKKQKKNKPKIDKVDITDARLSAYGLNPKKYKNKLKYGSK